jgi:O-succinylhomoserine sulfhydrylase
MTTPNDHFETDAIRTQAERSSHQEHAVPIYATSSFVFDTAEEGRARFAGEDDGLVYSRYANPNTNEFAEKLCRLEGAEAGIATASGMAAVFSSLAGLLEAGDHLLTARAVFGSTHQVVSSILPRWNIGQTFTDGCDPATWQRDVQPNTRIFLVESPTNPGLDIVDLSAAAAFCKAHGILLLVDNCFATPYLQKPLELGAHLVMHSGTKFIDGQGRVLGGAIVGAAELVDKIEGFTKAAGPALSPFNGWILSKSLETLAVRMDAHCARALALAERLEANPQVASVKYPYLPSHPQYDLARKQMRAGGGLVTFEVQGGLEQGMRCLNALKMASLTSNLGDTRTIATHPATTTHSKLTEEERQAVGVTPGLIRISVGLETQADIIADIEQALAASA